MAGNSRSRHGHQPAVGDVIMQAAEDTVGGKYEAIKPLARPVRDFARYLPFLVRAQWGSTDWQPHEPPVFVIGCGRSGTTLLGRLLGLHPRVHYLFEPRERWAVVCRSTDVALAFSRTGAKAFMGASFATPAARVRFSRVMAPPPGRVLVEKSPTNALRIPFLDALAPDSRFVHIVRDGDDVVRSIARKAARTRRVFGRGQVNDWWGSNDSKWKLLSQQGAEAGHYADEVGLLTSNHQRAAFEWLVSLSEVDCRRRSLGDRLHEVTYRDLTEDSSAALEDIARFLELDVPPRWLDQAAARVSMPAPTEGEQLDLPRGMADDFNGFQRRYGFKARARPTITDHQRHAAQAP
jgi:hypothetical protein